ncbi:MAG: aspartate aminotransferase family protein [Armatimonadetes bacterium]|nr:aspartate aminotransferase family protein [Armatimonadota bacterium]
MKHPVPAEQISGIVLETVSNFIHYIDPGLGKQMRLMAEDFVEWEAQGPYIWDIHGNEYLDGMTFGGVFGLGHRHPRVVEAVKQQLDRMPLSSRLAFNKPMADLGRLLAEVTPGDLQYTFVCSSGTESIEVALKLARLTTQRPHIVSTLSSFHGMSIACSSVSGIDYWRQGFFPLLDGVSLVPFGDIDALRKAVSPMTAAVLLEAVQAGSGCTVPPAGYLQQVRELCDRLGIMLVVDEIQTGFGRTGKMFGVDHEGVVPDIMCLGKFLGGGVMAIGACTYRPVVQQAADKRPLFNNTTFGGNPLACAAAIAAVRTVLDENLVERARVLGDRLGAMLDGLITKYPTVVEGAKGLGLMRTFVVRSIPQAFVVVQELISKHRTLLLSPVHTPTMFRVNPPINATDEVMDRILDAIDQSVAKAASMSELDMARNIQELQRKAAAMA